MRADQQTLLPIFNPKRQLHFGGSTVKGNPRQARILSTKHPLHLVLRSSKAVDAFSFLKKQKTITQILQKQAKHFNVTIYRYANAGNHLHLLVRAKNRREFAKFLRAIAGIIARIVLNRQRGHGKSVKEKFWDARPFTRIVSWGRDFLGVRSYLQMNQLEALGFLPLRKKIYVELCSTA